MKQQILTIFLLFSVILFARSQIPPSNCVPPQILPESCCSMPKFFDDNDLIKCKNFENSRTKRFATSRMELGTCYLDCVFQITGATYANGRILNTTNLLQILKRAASNEPQTITIIQTAVNQCVNELNSGAMKVRNPALYNCSTIPSSIMMCIHKKFFLSCPDNRYQNIQQCNQLKDFMMRCAVSI